MARDKGLEELIHDELRSVPDLSEKAMFGGWAWLLGGKLLCGARDDGMLVRLGKGNDGWALAVSGVQPMLSRGKPMSGWVRADASAYWDDEFRGRLLRAARQFVGSLPRQ
jgi:hypothetical protein